ncbi:MAG: arginine--tRNA ligase [Anaerolineae bacterium]|nr:arginine--tRNA ligase [Anaerolineae bacterium]
MKLLTAQFADLIRRAIEAAQTAGALPAFDIPEDIPVDLKDGGAQGDYAVPVALQLAKPARRAPRQVAEAIMQHLPTADFIGRAEIAGPGFLNFWLSPAWLAAQVDAILAEGAAAGAFDINAGKRAQVEFVSANPSGPITIAHTRGAVMGDTLANLLAATGYTVEREYYFNNAGRQMEIVGRSLRARYLEMLGEPFDFPEDGYRGQYFRWIAAGLVYEHGDALKDKDWPVFKDLAENIIFGHIRNSLRRIGIEFDNWFNENSLYESGAVDRLLEALREKDYAYDADGAVWFRMTAFGGEKDRVLVKSTGEPTYVTPDIMYHIDKLERGFDLAVNILGADHMDQYPAVAAGVRAMGYDPSPIHVIIHQAVTLVEGGATQRMSKRKGQFVTLDELVDEVGRDAVRYYILAYKPDAHINFDLELAKAQSEENPVYTIQYAHVRCMGVFRQAAEAGVTDAGADVSRLTGEREQSFLRKALELPQIIDFTIRQMEPHHLTTYALDLARLFHSTYETVRVLHGDTPPDLAKARLRFYKAAQVILARVLTLMGMTTPDRM